MKYIPILFNAEMVQAILNGKKTQTRRPLKPRFRENEAGFQIITNLHSGEFVRVEYYDEFEDTTRYMNPPCNPGDILWVRETWAQYNANGRIIYRADADGRDLAAHYNEYGNREAYWRPSIHMPREAARIFLRVKDVRVERLGEINDEDAIAEGANCKGGKNVGIEEKMRRSAVERFADIWNSTIKHKDYDELSFAASPWVWVITFERCEKPEEW